MAFLKNKVLSEGPLLVYVFSSATRKCEQLLGDICN